MKNKPIHSRGKLRQPSKWPITLFTLQQGEKQLQAFQDIRVYINSNYHNQSEKSANMTKGDQQEEK